MSKNKTTTGALATVGTMTQSNHQEECCYCNNIGSHKMSCPINKITINLSTTKCDGCKRAEGVKGYHVYTCNCNVK